MRQAQEYRFLVENANIIILKWTRDGHLTYINEFGEKLFGYSPKELIGRHVVGTIVPETESSGRDLSKITDDICERPEAYIYNVNENICKDGSRLWIAWTNTVFKDEDTSEIEVLGIGTDISAQHEAEEKLKERVKELNCLYNISKLVEKPDISLKDIFRGVVALIPSSWRYPDITCAKLVINDQNFATANYKETSRQLSGNVMVKGSRCGSLIVGYLTEMPESNEGPFLKEERMLINGICERLGRIIERKEAEQAIQKAKDELEFKVEERTSELKSVVVLLQGEISERKKAEDALRNAKEEIEKWNRGLEKRVKEKSEELVKSQAQLIQTEKLGAMGEMAGGLAHELNSPLAGLLPMIEQYKNEAAAGSRRHKELSIMHKACEHMAKIIRDFTSFSRESKGDFYALDPNKVIEDTLGFIASRIKQKGIQVIKEYEDTLPEIMGDNTGLQQVILNIITNALDALPDRGKLIIKTCITRDKNNVMMEFIDDGVGIDKQYLGKIFDPFYTTKRPGKGTGLGLSVSYKIIEKHGGKISVESESGNGTKFAVCLPIANSNNIQKEMTKK